MAHGSRLAPALAGEDSRQTHITDGDTESQSRMASPGCRAGRRGREAGGRAASPPHCKAFVLSWAQPVEPGRGPTVVSALGGGLGAQQPRGDGFMEP